MNHFILSDSRKCIGCQACEVACVMAHNEEQHVLTPQRFLPRITVIKAEGQRNAITCRHCEDAPLRPQLSQRRHRPVRRQRSGPSGEMHWL
ncbi:hypothetical protein LNP05_24370 [Klebsiella pneumoniae subsp. pneumoniae]|nr:hypothetical protein [Klebsiella pneumoniae subsp. pneumoniae]